MDIYRHVKKSTFDLNRVFCSTDYVGAYLDKVVAMGWKPISVFYDNAHIWTGSRELPADTWHFVFAGTSDLKDPLSPWEE